MDPVGAPGRQDEGCDGAVNEMGRPEMAAAVLLSTVVFAVVACGSGSGGGGAVVAADAAIEFEAAIAVTRSVKEMPTRLVATDAASFQAAVREANLIGCGVEIAVSGEFRSDATLASRCPEADDLGIRVIGPARIEGELNAWCRGTGCAWTSFEGLDVVNPAGDAFDCGGDVGMLVLDSHASVSGRYNNVLTAHQRCRLLAIGVSGSAGGDEFAPAIAVIDDSKATILGRGEFVASEYPDDSVVHVGGSNGGVSTLLIVGPVLTCRIGSQYAIDFVPGFRGRASVISAALVANCPTHMRLYADEEASWRSYRDSIPGVADQSTSGSATIAIDDQGSELVIELPVAIPAWVDGRGSELLRVQP